MPKDEKPEYEVKLRNLTINDYGAMAEMVPRVYKGPLGVPWKRESIERVIQDFPEGQLGIEINGKLAAFALALIVNYADYGDEHKYAAITGNERLDTHNPNGDVLYGVEVLVDPEYQGMRLGRRLYDARKELCEGLGLRSIVLGGRIPGYNEYAGELSPREYIEKVRLKEIYDPILTFQLSNSFHVRKVLRGYMPGDTQSQEFATLLEWNNIYNEKPKSLIGKQKSFVRLALIQWQMRRADAVDAVIEQLEFFVDAVSAHEADFVLFPELFNAPLMAKHNEQGEAEAIRALAGYTETIFKRCQELSVAYNINIIAGSMPLVDDSGLYNISYLCRRDGTTDSYRKIHIAPSERHYWGMVGGDKLRAFDSDCGKIGILISTDVEYPELGRFYADQGVKILFVPFMTSTRNSYSRVRWCAQARAIENECYVAIAGSVGNLPKVHNMDIQYAESGVFSPADFAFPADAIVSLASPNAEITLIADVDLDLLRELSTRGLSQNLKDRRHDLYQLSWKGQS